MFHNVFGSNFNIPLKIVKWCWTVQARTYGGGHAQRFFLPKNWTPDASAFSAFWRESSHMHCVRCCNKAALKKMDFDTSTISFGISFMKKKSMTSKGFLGKVCQKCTNLWVVDFLRENSWKLPELTLRLWIQKCPGFQLCEFGMACGTWYKRYKRYTWYKHVQKRSTNSKNSRMPNATAARIFESRGLLCSVTKPQLPLDDTLYIFLPAWTWKSWCMLISICIVCIPPVPLVLALILHCHHVSSCLQLKCSRKANACDWGSMMQSSGLKSSPQTESWNFGDRNQPHFMNSIQFRSTLGYNCSCFRIAGLSEVDSCQKTQSSLSLTRRIYVFLEVLSTVEEIQRNV